MNYGHGDARAYARQLALVWDQDFARRIDAVAFENDISQDQFDVLAREYIWKVKCLFTPTYYPLGARLLIALKFINPFARSH